MRLASSGVDGDRPAVASSAPLATSPVEAIYVKLVRQVRGAQANTIQAHAQNIAINALGQRAEYLKDDDGKIVRDSSGQPILLRPAVPPSWQASARYLEAVDHERWGRKIRQELTTPEGGPTELRVTIRKKREVKKREES